jgi:N,N'-diacetyllegionaminate synthase
MTFQIGDTPVGGGRVFVIAEAGVNHNGDLDLALKLVEAAADAGADAVKFQTFRTDRLVSPGTPRAKYQEAGAGESVDQHALLARLELSPDAHRTLFRRAHHRGITFLSSPFDTDSADFLVELGVPAIKVGSGDLTAPPLLSHYAHYGLPLIVSTGMATIAEVADAVDLLTREGLRDLALLHCVSEYPALVADCNLRAIPALRRAFDVPVGWSDHTLGRAAALAAVALGADLVEKHLTLDRSLPGPDHRASAEPDELGLLIAEIRELQAGLGDGVKRPTPGELAMRAFARRSLAAACQIPEGAALTEQMVEMTRPGDGLPWTELPLLLGRRARHPIAAGAHLREEDLA